MFVRKINFVFVVLLIASCVQINLATPKVSVSKITKVKTFQLKFHIKKFAYSVLDSTFFVMDDNQKIHILKNEKEVNIIGGIGFGSDQFMELTDFCIDKNGHLLTLDRMRRKLLIFDSTGNKLSQIDISFINSPILISQLDSGSYVCFDNTAKEAVIFPEWQTKDFLKFGQFEINSPQYLKTNQNKIFFYDKQSEETSVYDDFGNFLENKAGKFLCDKFNNYFEFTEHFIIQDSLKLVSVENINLFDIFDREILVAGNNKIGIYSIEYEK